jgi:hypothetical protein
MLGDYLHICSQVVNLFPCPVTLACLALFSVAYIKKDIFNLRITKIPRR